MFKIEKNRDKLIKELMSYELNDFLFIIFSRENKETHEEEYKCIIEGSYPEEDGWEFICYIGGEYDVEYTKHYITTRIFGS